MEAAGASDVDADLGVEPIDADVAGAAFDGVEDQVAASTHGAGGLGE